MTRTLNLRPCYSTFSYLWWIVHCSKPHLTALRLPQSRRDSRCHCALYTFTYLLTKSTSTFQKKNSSCQNDKNNKGCVRIRAVPDYESGKSRIQPFFGNPSESGSGQISSRILNCTASLQQLTVLMTLVSSGVLFCDPKTSSAQIRMDRL